MRRTLLLICTAWLFLPGVARPQGVVLITIDTLRADHLHSFGYKLRTSPNLDRLAADGVRFVHCYTPIPLTLPSHTAMMTGTLPPRNGVEDYTSIFQRHDLPTLAELFRHAGYATAAIVAAPVLDHRFGLSRGFDLYDDRIQPVEAADFDVVAKRPANIVVTRALEWLRHHEAAKFFLWIHLYDPHEPYLLAPAYRRRFRNPYDGEIAFADHELGRLLSYLRSRGLYERTTIAVVGDHGESLGEHGEKTHGFFIYDSTLHVPLILKVPAGVTRPAGIYSGLTVAANVSTIDIFPTLLQLAHISLPSVTDAYSLLEPLANGGTSNDKRPLFAESELPRTHFGWSDLRAIRFRHYEYILAPRAELYDLSTDPSERVNLAVKDYMRGRSLRLEVVRWDGQLRGHPGPAPLSRRAAPVPSPEMQEVLRSLGYIGGSSESPPVGELDSLSLPDPKDRIAAYNLVAVAAQEIRHAEPREAIAAIRKAEAIDRRCATIHIVLGQYILGEPSSTLRTRAAMREFASALKLTPDDPDALWGLALAYYRLGNMKAAALGFRRVLRINPNADWAALQLGQALYSASEFPEAAAAYQGALRINPHNPVAWTGLSVVYLRQGKLRLAEEALREAVKLNPDSAQAHFLLWKVYRFEHRTELSEKEDEQLQGLGFGVAAPRRMGR